MNLRKENDMISVLLILTALISFISLVLFHAAPFPAVIVIIAAVALFVLRSFSKKIKLLCKLIPLLSFVLVTVCIIIPQKNGDYGYYDYSDMYEDYFNAVCDGDEDAGEKLDAIKEKYRETDDVRFIEAMDAISKEDYDLADRIAYGFDDILSRQFYIIRENVLLHSRQERDDDVDFDRLRNLYVEAADANPEWVYAQKCAGGYLFDDEEYDAAAYYLTSAYANMEEPDPMIMYYLGAVMMEKGEYEKACELFDEALQAGADDEMRSNIAYYIQNAGMEGLS